MHAVLDHSHRLRSSPVQGFILPSTRGAGELNTPALPQGLPACAGPAALPMAGPL